MTDDELLNRARVFDAGPPPVVNGFVLDEDDDSQGNNLAIEYRGSAAWTICSGSRCCLNKKTGELEHEPCPSRRDEDFVARTRFTSPAEAFAFLAEWKAREREKALREPWMIRWKDQLALWAKEKEAKS